MPPARHHAEGEQIYSRLAPFPTLMPGHTERARSHQSPRQSLDAPGHRLGDPLGRRGQ